MTSNEFNANLNILEGLASYTKPACEVLPDLAISFKSCDCRVMAKAKQKLSHARLLETKTCDNVKGLNA